VIGNLQIGFVPEGGFLTARGDGGVKLGQEAGQLGQCLATQASELHGSRDEGSLEGIQFGITAATLEEGVALTKAAVVVSQSLEVNGG
jgi:hypothetical protein